MFGSLILSFATSFMFIRKYFAIIIMGLGLSIWHVLWLVKAAKRQADIRDEVNGINAYTKAVEEVDNMDDDGLIDTLSSVRPAHKTLHDTNQDTAD